MSASPKILVVDDNLERASHLEQALHAAGYAIVVIMPAAQMVVQRVQEIGPDVIIIDMDSPSRDVLESMRRINADQPRPIVIFVDQSDEAMITEAMQAGVSAYVIDGLNTKRVKPILDVAIARFKEFQSLKSELARTKATLAERKVIEKAKGILMRERQMTEVQAYTLLRKLAMDRQQRLADVAEALIQFSEVLAKP